MSTLFIRKTEGDFENILARDARTRVAAHIQIPLGAAIRRVVVAMPARKAALCFAPADPADWALADDWAPVHAAGGRRGIRFTLTTPRPEVVIPIDSILMHHTLMARFGVDPANQHENRLRGLFQSDAIQELESGLGMSLRDLADRGQTVGPIVDNQTGAVTFTRRALDGKHHYRLEFAGGRELTIRESDGGRRLILKNPAAPARLRLTIRASTDFEPLTPMPSDELLNDRGREWRDRDPLFAQALDNFEFLAYREKFLAGSWNFLSYFGRDTLIALRLMWPVLSPPAKQTGIQSVMNEIAPDGIVNVTDEWTDDRTMADAIERFFLAYDHGKLDDAKSIMRAILAGNVPEHPFLDVLEQTFLFPAAAAHWFRELDDSRLNQWLNEEHRVLGRTEANRVTLLRNWNYILQSAAPYIAAWRHSRAPAPNAPPPSKRAPPWDEWAQLREALVHSIAGAANWRDTYNLPWRFSAEDINVNLLPMAIAAMQAMAERIGAAGGRPALLDTARQQSLDTVGAYLETPGHFDAARAAWDREQLRAHYRVRRDAQALRRDLARYLEGLQNGDVFGPDRERGFQERNALLRCQVDGMTVAEFLRGERVPAALQAGVECTALFLDPAGRPVPLMHSDDVYFLLFGQPTMEQFREIIRPLVLPYPFGLGFLDDELGVAVTSAVYSPRDNDALQDHTKNVWVKFGPDEYHGRSAWPWVLWALISGIHDQIMRAIDPAGRRGSEVTPDDVALFKKLLRQAQSTIRHLGPYATSEVYRFIPAPAGQRIWQAAPLGISTPIQLWSAAPVNLLINEALARIEMGDSLRNPAGDGSSRP